MAVSFTHLSWWTWSGRLPRISQGPSLNPTLESDAFKFPLRAKMTSPSRRVKRKWHSREERKTGVEYDMVLVSSDDECFSGWSLMVMNSKVMLKQITITALLCSFSAIEEITITSKKILAVGLTFFAIRQLPMIAIQQETRTR